MALPNFLIVGAMKAGTTSLADALALHPQVFVPAAKEPNSLVDDRILSNTGLATYEALFERGAGASALGEASTGYTKRHLGGADAALHASAVLGADLRLIYLVRDPVDRALSHAKHLLNSGRGFDATQEIEPDNPVCEVSCYAYQIEPWRAAFPGDQLLLIDMHDLVGEWTPTSEKICSHLGIDPTLMPPLGRANASNDARPASGILGSVLRSDMYRKLVQERLPLPIRRKLRRGLVRRASSPTINLDDLQWTSEAIDRMRSEVDTLHRETGLLVRTPTLDRISNST